MNLPTGLPLSGRNPESGIRPIAVDLSGARHVRCVPTADPRSAAKGFYSIHLVDHGLSEIVVEHLTRAEFAPVAKLGGHV
jgi:hypothetical protein